MAERGRPICVLASGDPFVYGVGSALARLGRSRLTGRITYAKPILEELGISLTV